MKLITSLLWLLSLTQVALVVLAGNDGVDDGTPQIMVSEPLPPHLNVSRKTGYEDKFLLSAQHTLYYTLHPKESPVQYFDSYIQEFTNAKDSFFWKDLNDETNKQFLVNAFRSTAELTIIYQTIDGSLLYFTASGYFISEHYLVTAGHTADPCVCRGVGTKVAMCGTDGYCDPGSTPAYLQCIQFTLHDGGRQEGDLFEATVLEHEIVYLDGIGDIWRDHDIAILRTDYKSKYYVNLIDYDNDILDTISNKDKINSYSFFVIGYPYLHVGSDLKIVGKNSMEYVDLQDYRGFWRFYGFTRKYISAGNVSLSKYDSLAYHTANTHDGFAGGPAVWISGEKRGVVGVHVGYIGSQPSNAFVTTKSPLLAKYVVPADKDDTHDEL